MNVECMIFIDHFIGSPVCWMLTQFHKLHEMFSQKADAPCKKVLFIKPSEMGTSVIVYPTIKEALDFFPGSDIFFLVFKENSEILKVLNIIPEENILTLRTTSIFLFLRDIYSVLLRLRREKIDVAIDLEFFSRFTSIISYLSGAKKRVGFYGFNMRGIYRGDLLTHQVNYNYNVHCGVSFMSLLRALKYDGDSMPLREAINQDDLVIPKIKIEHERQDRIWAKLRDQNPGIDSSKKIVIMNPNTSQLVPFRKWPLEYYIDLAGKLIPDDQNIYVVITGIKEDIPDGRKIFDSVKSERCIDFTGKTSIRELLELFSIAKVLVSVDSGAAHFATLTNINIVCIFGPDTPIIFAPLSKNCVCLTSGYVCNPCMTVFNDRKPICKDRQKPCLTSITVERVYDEVKRFLG